MSTQIDVPLATPLKEGLVEFEAPTAEELRHAYTVAVRDSLGFEASHEGYKLGL